MDINVSGKLSSPLLPNDSGSNKKSKDQRTPADKEDESKSVNDPNSNEKPKDQRSPAGEEPVSKEQAKNVFSKKIDDKIKEVEKGFRNAMMPVKNVQEPDGAQCFSEVIISADRKIILSYKVGGTEIFINFPTSGSDNFKFKRFTPKNVSESEKKLPDQNQPKLHVDKLVEVVFGKANRIYYILKDGRLFTLEIDIEHKRISDAREILCCWTPAEILTLFYSEEFIYFSTSKSELIEYSIENKSPIIIDRLSQITQISVSKGNRYIAYANINTIRVYSKDTSWLEFESIYDLNEKLSLTIEFSHGCDPGLLFIANGKTIRSYEVKFWKEGKSWIASSNIKAFKVTDDDAFIVALCSDFGIVVWECTEKNSSPIFMNNDITDITTFDASKPKNNEKNLIEKQPTSKDLDKFKIKHSIKIDYNRNLIYTTEKNNRYILRWNGPFLDKESLAGDSTVNKFKQQMAINRKNNLVFLTDYESKKIHFWDVNIPSSKPEPIKIDCAPLCIQINNNEKYLAIGCEKEIHIWGLESTGIKRMKTLSNKVVVKDENTLNSDIFDVTFSVHKITQEPDKIIEVDILYYCSGGNIYEYNIDSDDKKKLKGKSGDPSFPLWVREKPKKPESGNPKKPESEHSLEICKVLECEFNTLLIGCQSGTVYSFNIGDKTLKFYRNWNYDTEVKAIVPYKLNKTTLDWFISASNTSFIVWSVVDNSIIKEYDTKLIIDSLYLSESESELIVAHQNGSIVVYNLPGFIPIIVLNYDSSQKLNLQSMGEDSSVIPSSTDNLINQEGLEPPTQVDGQPDDQSRRPTTQQMPKSDNKIICQAFCFTEGEKYLIVSNKAGIYKTKSPLSENNVRAYGSSINIWDINLLLVSKPDEIKKNTNFKKKQPKWLIGPYSINSLHYYAKYNLNELLKQEMINNALYLNSDIRFPLDISLNSDHIEASSVILSELRKKAQTDLYALESINSIIVDLNNKGFKGLDELYKFCLVQNYDIDSKYVDGSVSLPLIKFADSYKVDESFYNLPKLRENDEKQRVKYFRSCLRLNLVIGSQESIDFLESIHDCNNHDIFDAKYIKTIIQYKWIELRWIIIIQTLLNSVYLIPICIYVITNDFYPYLTISAIFNTLLLVYEGFQFYGSRLGYFGDYMNYIDLIRSFLFYFYYLLIYQKSMEKFAF